MTTYAQSAVQATAELDTIPFRGDSIQVTVIDGKAFLVAKTVFDNIGLDADRQIGKLQKQPWATTAVTAVVAADGKVRDMVVADVRTILMALATIPSSRVSVAARGTLIAYQNEVADVIEAYYAKGMAPINPRVAPDQVAQVVDRAIGDYRTEREKRIAEAEAERRSLATVAEAQLSMLGTAVSLGLVDSSWAKTDAQIILAKGKGEAAVVAEEEMPLYVEDFMKSMKASRKGIRNFSGSFGKKVIEQAGREMVAVPGKRPQETANGTIREITAWTKEHQPLFERAWAASYANDPRVFS